MAFFFSFVIKKIKRILKILFIFDFVKRRTSNQLLVFLSLDLLRNIEKWTFRHNQNNKTTI